MCTPYIESQKMVPWQRPLGARYRQYLHCQPTTQTPTITSYLVAVVLTKPVIAILVPKLVAMATTLRHSMLVGFLRIAWPQKPTPRIKQRVASCHTTKVIAHQRPKPVMANCIPKLVAIATSSAPVDSHLTHDSLGPSKPTSQAASRSVQLSVRHHQKNIDSL